METSKIGIFNEEGVINQSQHDINNESVQTNDISLQQQLRTQLSNISENLKFDILNYRIDSLTQRLKIKDERIAQLTKELSVLKIKSFKFKQSVPSNQSKQSNQSYQSNQSTQTIASTICNINNCTLVHNQMFNELQQTSSNLLIAIDQLTNTHCCLNSTIAQNSHLFPFISYLQSISAIKSNISIECRMTISKIRVMSNVSFNNILYS